MGEGDSRGRASTEQRIRDLNERMISAAAEGGEAHLDVWERALVSFVAEAEGNHEPDVGAWVLALGYGISRFSEDMQHNTDHPAGPLPGTALTGLVPRRSRNPSP